MSKILVTGATGFIGKYVISELLKYDLEIFSVERINKSRQEFDKKINIIHTHDLFSESTEWWQKICKDIDIILHLAWFTKSREYLDAYQNIKCLTGSLNLAQGAANAGVKRFVGIGTSVEYDLSFKTLSIDTPLKPLSVYAASKAGLFINLSQFLPINSVDFVWCRIFNVFGESNDSYRLVPYLKSKHSLNQEVNLSNGKHIRDFMNVKEVARIISEVTLGSKTGAINICSGIPKSVQEVASEIANQLKKSHLLKFDEIRNNLDDYQYIVGVPNYNT